MPGITTEVFSKTQIGINNGEMAERFKVAVSKCVGLCGSHVAENLGFMGFSKPPELE